MLGNCFLSTARTKCGQLFSSMKYSKRGFLGHFWGITSQIPPVKFLCVQKVVEGAKSGVGAQQCPL